MQLAGVPAASLGPNSAILVADWMLAALNGKPFPSERWFVDATGGWRKPRINEECVTRPLVFFVGS